MKGPVSRALLLSFSLVTIACSQFKAAKIDFAQLPSLSDLSSSGDEPMVKITSITQDPSNSTVVQVNGTCTKGSKIQLWEANVTNKIEFLCLSGSFNQKLTVTPGDGAKNIFASSIVGTKQIVDSRSMVIDTNAPMMQLSTPMEQTPFQSELELVGVCEANLPVTVSGDIPAALTVNCDSSGTFRQKIVLSNGEGTKTIRLSQSDAALNKTEINRTFIRDNTVPVVRITSPAANTSVTSTVMLSGTCESGFNVEITGAGTNAKSIANCAQGAFSAEIALSSGNGAKQITINQADAAGNIGTDSRSFNLQTTGPQILISSPAALTQVKSTLTLKGSCQSGLPIQISGSGLASTLQTSCNSGAFSVDLTLSNSDGPKQIRVSQTNGSGSEGADVRTFIKDSIAPVIKILEPAARTATKNQINIQGSCEAGIDVVIWGPGTTQTSSAACASGAFSASVALASGDGDKEVRVSQTDLATNYATDTRIFVRDTTAPQVQITTPVAGASVTTPVLDVTGSCEGALNVQVSGAGVKSPVSASCSMGAFTASVALTDGNGAKSLNAEQMDAAGNKGTHAISVTRAAPAPVLDGKVLYANNCAACHNALENSNRLGRTAAQISASIFGSGGAPGIAQMSHLKFLTVDEIAAIADALGGSQSANQAVNPFACANPASAPIQASDTPRLTKQQLMNTYLSLLGASIYNSISAEFAGLQPDASVPARGYTPEEVDTLHQLASKTADAVVANSTNLKAIVGSCAGSTITATCAGQFIDSFGLRALRRPPTAAEKTALTDIFKAYSNSNEGIKAIVLYLLQAPQFLYHVEVGADTDSTPSTSPFRLTSYELVSRLSYLLTDTMPDAQLFQAAAAGQLSGSQLAAQVDRLLLSASGKAKVRRFYDAYLKLQPITSLGTYPAAFLNGLNTNGLATEMQRELDEYIETMVFTEKAGFSKFMTDKRSYARTPALAQIYGHSLASSSTAVQTMGGDRKGILMRAPMLLSFDVGTHPILRGVRIQKNILCEEIGDPPAKLENPSAPADLSLATYSSRDFYMHKTNSSSCLGCHSKINPPGFLLEGFDALGRFQSTESRYDDQGRVTRSFPIVTAVDGLNIEAGASSSFQNASQFIDELASSQKGPSCFVRQAFRFYQSRTENANDSCTLQPMYQNVIGANGSMLDAIRSGINSTSLQYKMSRP